MVKYIVVYDKNTDLSALQTELTNSGCNILRVFEQLNTILVEASNSNFASSNGILTTEEEVQFEITAHWHLQRITSINLPMNQLYLPKNFGDGSTVYLVDSGVDTTHSEFSGSAISQLWSWNSGSGDSNGHGTGMASLIVGKTLGVSPNATLKSVDIPLGTTITTSVLLDALDTILADHLLTPSSVKVVNCSWTIPKSSILDSKITELEQHGLVVVAAAGNNVVDADTLSPVGLNTVIGVAASDAYDRVLSNCGYGPEVDITAPGIDVSVAMLDGTIGASSGTSNSAAIVSGIVCHFITNNTSLNAQQVQDAVIASGTPDILFRNETIYGTTPNLLAHTLSAGSLFLTPPPEDLMVYIQRGTTYSTEITYRSPIASLNIHDVSVGSITKTVPDWVTLTDDILTAIIPSNLEAGKYSFTIEGLSENNQRVQLLHIYLCVYVNDASELAEVEVYNYYTTENTEIIVIQSLCSNKCIKAPSQDCTNLGKTCHCTGAISTGSCFP